MNFPSLMVRITLPINQENFSERKEINHPQIRVKPESVISVMMIIAIILEQMFCRFEGAMGVPL